MFNVQKCSKDIVKIVHATSVVQPSFYEATRTLSVHLQNTNLNLCSGDEQKSYGFGRTWW